MRSLTPEEDMAGAGVGMAEDMQQLAERERPSNLQTPGYTAAQAFPEMEPGKAGPATVRNLPSSK